MATNESNKHASVSEDPLAFKPLSWMFLKSMVFCALICVVVLGMAEFVSN